MKKILVVLVLVSVSLLAPLQLPVAHAHKYWGLTCGWGKVTTPYFPYERLFKLDLMPATGYIYKGDLIFSGWWTPAYQLPGPERKWCHYKAYTIIWRWHSNGAVADFDVEAPLEMPILYGDNAEIRDVNFRLMIYLCVDRDTNTYINASIDIYPTKEFMDMFIRFMNETNVKDLLRKLILLMVASGIPETLVNPYAGAVAAIAAYSFARIMKVIVNPVHASISVDQFHLDVGNLFGWAKYCPYVLNDTYVMSYPFSAILLLQINRKPAYYGVFKIKYSSKIICNPFIFWSPCPSRKTLTAEAGLAIDFDPVPANDVEYIVSRVIFIVEGVEGSTAYIATAVSTGPNVTTSFTPPGELIVNITDQNGWRHLVFVEKKVSLYRILSILGEKPRLRHDALLSNMFGKPSYIGYAINRVGNGEEASIVMVVGEKAYREFQGIAAAGDSTGYAVAVAVGVLTAILAPRVALHVARSNRRFVRRVS